MSHDARIYTTYDCQWHAHEVSFWEMTHLVGSFSEIWLKVTYRSVGDPKQLTTGKCHPSMNDFPTSHT